jgi:hypothetical protein
MFCNLIFIASGIFLPTSPSCLAEDGAITTAVFEAAPAGSTLQYAPTRDGILIDVEYNDAVAQAYGAWSVGFWYDRASGLLFEVDSPLSDI